MEEILKHVSTRWISLEKCVGCTISQWEALRIYFNSHKDCDRSVKLNDVQKLM